MLFGPLTLGAGCPRWECHCADQDQLNFIAERFTIEISAVQARLLKIVQEGIDKVNGSGNGAEEDSALVDVAKRIANIRKLRRGYFSSELFHERAWDMLLELFIAHTTNREVWVKSVLSVADGSPTTAIRWLDHMEASGLILRRADDADRRRVIVSLTQKGEETMANYLQEARSAM